MSEASASAVARHRSPGGLDSHRNNTYSIAVAIFHKAGKTGIKCGDFPAPLQSRGYEQSIGHLAETLDSLRDLHRQVMH